MTDKKQPESEAQSLVAPTAAKKKGRKLRTPFRRRRGDATPHQGRSPAAEEGGTQRGATAKANPMRRARKNARPRPQNERQRDDSDIGLSFLGTIEQTSQRLGRFLNSEAGKPKLHKVLADAGIGSRRDMEELIISGRVSVNSEPAYIGQRVGTEDVVRVNGRIVQRPDANRPPRIIIYHKPAGEIVSHDDPKGRDTVFSRLPKIRMGKWLSIGRLDLNTEGLLMFTNSGDLANRFMHPRYGAEREYAVRVLGELTEEQMKQLTDGIQLEDGMAKFGTVEFIGGEGSNRWYRVTIHEGRNREVRRMMEAMGLTVSRLIRTRFGEVVLPSSLRRGRWEELSPEMATALMVRLGLLRADGSAAKTPRQRGGRRAHQQPLTHDSALPPGYRESDRVAARRTAPRRGAFLPQHHHGSMLVGDSTGTGLLVSGGLPNGHPNAGHPGARKRAAKKSTRAARQPRRGDRQPGAGAHESKLARVGRGGRR